ncbi:MAG: hypothetical protein AAB420_00010 [Patescibacteria group bacterium]
MAEIAPAEKKKDFKAFRFEQDNIWIGGEKVDYKDAFKLETMARALEAEEKLGELSLDDFILLMLRKELGKKEGVKDSQDDPRLVVIMGKYKKKFEQFDEHWKDVEHLFKELRISEDDLRVEKYQ